MAIIVFERIFQLLRKERVARLSTSLSGKTICHRKWLVAFLLVIGTALGFAAGRQRAILSASTLEDPFAPMAAAAVSPAGGSKSEIEGKEGTFVSAAGVQAIQAAIAHVQDPGLQSLAKALGLSYGQIGHRVFEDSEIGMEPISLTGKSGVPEVAVKWRAPVAGRGPQSKGEPSLYLLSWGGNAWQASYLTPAVYALTVQVLPGTASTAPLIAVVIYRGMAAVPYPVIFRLTDHHASLAWDGRVSTSLYSGYDYGSIQFKKVENADVPVMLAAGLADPGLLVFPNSSQQSGRGFHVAAAYAWQHNAYVRIRTEYTQNRDYTLYRFISALHLHEYEKAYSLIDPKQFLKSDKPSLKLFRESILKTWPEFIDDRIFEVPAKPVKGSGSHVFILRLGHGKMNVYHPAFTPGPAYRLTGLTRTETSE
ncbi:MAG: hypothetical protein P8Z30_13835 [Acidobacteriota bacterium]